MFASNAPTCISRTAAARHQGFGPRLVRGLTMIELMVVVAILGIIAAVGIPQYTEYVGRGRATDATTQLATARIRLEQYYQDARTYTGAPAAICPTNTTHFQYNCTIAPNAYLLVATGVGDMVGYMYSINNTGAQNSTFAGVAGNGCWLSRKGGAC